MTQTLEQLKSQFIVNASKKLALVRKTPKRSRCCRARIWMSRADGVSVGSCSKCTKNIVRVNPRIESIPEEMPKFQTAMEAQAYSDGKAFMQRRILMLRSLVSETQSYRRVRKEVAEWKSTAYAKSEGNCDHYASMVTAYQRVLNLFDQPDKSYRMLKVNKCRMNFAAVLIFPAGVVSIFS